MPRIDLAAVPERKGSGYPPPFDQACADRIRQRLGNAGGLTDFGVNLMHLPPGNWSSQRHWHSAEDGRTGWRCTSRSARARATTSRPAPMST